VSQKGFQSLTDVLQHPVQIIQKDLYSKNFLVISCPVLAEEWILVAPADAAGGEEEPVHEDPGAVVVGVIGQQPVPLVSLLTGAVSGAPRRARLSADLLVYRLLELLVVDDGPHLAVAVARPEWGHYLY